MVTEPDILLSLNVVSNTKDSIYVEWDADTESVQQLHGHYNISYQAVGSSVMQYSHEIQAEYHGHDLTKLHENTYYKICISVYSNSTQLTEDICVKASTTTDSLSVALGSTFGAFLALGIIVFFVFIAKWQHNRRLEKQMALAGVTPSGDSYDSMAQPYGDYEMSDMSGQAPDDTTQIELSEQTSAAANGVARQLNGDVEGAVTSDHISDACIPIVSIEDPTGSEQSSLLPPPSSIVAIPNMQDGKPIDVRPKVLEPRPPDGRPKANSIVAPLDGSFRHPALTDLNNTFSTSMFVEPGPLPGVSLKPNLSCNW